MNLVKWVFLASTFIAVLLYFQRDTLPDPGYYDSALLTEPVQVKTVRQLFETDAGDQHYQIKPKYDYELNGVVVSLHNADSLRDIWHHSRWKDFLNVRDLCVIWGNNVSSGVYQKVDFSNDSWTCWAQWYDNETTRQFAMNQISNNHLLVDDEMIKDALMSARIGDQIRLSGHLAAYRNPANNFIRGTSITRNDTGNGACETIYVTDFEIIKTVNKGKRAGFSVAKWTSIITLILLVINLFKSPLATKRR